MDAINKLFKTLVLLFVSFSLFASPATAGQPHTSVSWQEQTKDINHPAEEIEKISSECWQYHKLFPNVSKAMRLSRNQCYVETQISWKGIKFGTFWMKVQIRKLYTSADGRTIKLAVVKTEGNVKHFEAEATLIKLANNTTRTILRVKADPGLPGVPDSIIEDNIRSFIQSFYKRLNLRLEKGDYNFSVNY